MTPAEAFTGAKPSVSNFKVFDNDAYVHISDHKRSPKPRNANFLVTAHNRKHTGYEI